MYNVGIGIAAARHRAKRAAQLMAFIVMAIAGGLTYILWMLMR